MYLIYTAFDEGDEVKVLNQYQHEILRLKRKLGWGSKAIYKFYKHEKLILETSYNRNAFRNRVEIIHQNLEHEVLLTKKSSRYILLYREFELRIKLKIGVNPLFKFYKNGSIYGEVDMNPLISLAGTPITYKLFFLEREEINFYFLIFFLMNESPPYA